ncbi:hypothetical protein LSTR_LSTR003858 [Laodelphax striatellus]|uniref:Selenocysteine-specific elongation factor n=1 Tax=Laodelphax striatellus TaxID=195883 RepID=A0A482XG10_LAOST|nr:hypothetical protein LSTR_LSTR003858 [Laodelphax striatellus]
MEDTLNLNIGILGHVDSGKTSLAKRISQIASTASFDKNPQSQERGITIDLGFSSLKCPIPEHLKGPNDKLQHLQFTFVDCPGHASLLRTVIGGAQIIDMIILVLDICKGIQTQTAECLILGEVFCRRMVVVLNKIDMIPEEKRALTIQKMSKRMHLTLKDSIFKDSPIVSLAANPGGSDNSSQMPVGIDNLIEVLKSHAEIPERCPDKPLLFAVDHCFGIRGQGTVLTGTVLQGSVSLGDDIEIPSLKILKKVKSMQMFRQNVNTAKQGDRLGICVKQLDSNKFERGIVCSPSYSSTIHAAIIPLNFIKYFKSHLNSHTKFHISIGYETVIARVTIFRSCTVEDSNFDVGKEYVYVKEFCHVDTNGKEVDDMKFKHFMLIEFETAVLTTPNCLVIGSRLDMDMHKNNCRLAFWGSLILGFTDKNYSKTDLPNLRIFSSKTKVGTIDRVVDRYTVIGKNIFKKDTNLAFFVGLEVGFSTGEMGIIEGGFGQSGKIKIAVKSGGLSEGTMNRMEGKKKGKAAKDSGDTNEVTNSEPIRFTLSFKKFKYVTNKKITQ